MTQPQSGPVCVTAFEFDIIVIHSVHCLINYLTIRNQMHSVNV